MIFRHEHVHEYRLAPEAEAVVRGTLSRIDLSLEFQKKMLELLMLKIEHIEHMEKHNMSATDDLNNAVTALASGFTALDSAVQAEMAALATALANAGVNNDPAIQTATANITKITSNMAADAAALTASIPAATTVPPPPPPPATPVPPTVTPPTIAPVTVTDPSATPPAPTP